jgi:acyl dehydratase
MRYPPMTPTLLRLALAARRPASLPPGATVPPIEVVIRAVPPDPDRLAALRGLCGLPDDDRMPPTWPHLLATRSHLAILADPAFPVRPLGLVHMAQRIEVLRPLPGSASLDLHCRVAGHRDVPAGQAFDLHTRADAGGEVVWRGVSTYLARRPRAGRSPGARAGSADHPAAGATSTDLAAAADTGRRYARLSGDWNPIHLWPATARLFGFERAIAHGMWTLASVLGAIDRAQPDSRAHARTVEARFGRPVLLPAGLRLWCDNAPAGPSGLRGAIAFRLEPVGGGAAHADGTVRVAVGADGTVA